MSISAVCKEKPNRLFIDGYMTSDIVMIVKKGMLKKV